MMVRGERDTLSPGVHEDLYTMYLSEVYHSIINIIGIPHLGYPGYRVQYPRNNPLKSWCQAPYKKYVYCY
jgi:hypothetical protein